MVNKLGNRNLATSKYSSNTHFYHQKRYIHYTPKESFEKCNSAVSTLNFLLKIHKVLNSFKVSIDFNLHS